MDILTSLSSWLLFLSAGSSLAKSGPSGGKGVPTDTVPTGQPLATMQGRWGSKVSSACSEAQVHSSQKRCCFVSWAVAYN